MSEHAAGSCCGTDTAGTMPEETAAAVTAGEHVDGQSQLGGLPVVVIGAGPVGLAAAAHLHERGLPFTVLEAGPTARLPRLCSGGTCGCSPRGGTTSTPPPAAFSTDAGWVAPDPEACRPAATGRRLPAAAGEVARSWPHAPVRRPGHGGHPRSASTGSAPPAARPHRSCVRLADGDDVLARAVIDASGTWATPQPARRLRAPRPRRGRRRRIASTAPLPDVLGADRDRFAGTPHPGRRRRALRRQHPARPRRPGRAGTGHPDHSGRSAAAASPRTYGGGDADALPGPRRRSAPGCARLVEAGTHRRCITGFAVHTLRAAERRRRRDRRQRRRARCRGPDRRGHRLPPRPRHPAELRLDLDPALGSTRALAPLIDPNEHSCGTVPPHGADDSPTPRRLLHRRHEVLRPRADLPARHRLRTGPLRRRRPGRRPGCRPRRPARPARNRRLLAPPLAYPATRDDAAGHSPAPESETACTESSRTSACWG